MTKPIQVLMRQCFYSPNTSLSNRKRPDWFDKVKVFQNFKNTINPELADLKIVYDEKFGPLEETFLKDEPNVEVINYGYEAGSFSRTVDIAVELDVPDDTIIYFLEDDYLHRPGWCEALLEGFTLETNYVSLYDHLDKYIDKGYDDLVSKVMVSENSHWRTVPSTCNTYAARLGTLKADYSVHKHFSDASPDGISMDHAKFCHLRDHLGRRLITPMPGYATHCDLLHSPTIDWEEIIKRES